MRGFESLAMARIVQVPLLKQDPLSSMHIQERTQLVLTVRKEEERRILCRGC